MSEDQGTKNFKPIDTEMSCLELEVQDALFTVGFKVKAIERLFEERQKGCKEVIASIASCTALILNKEGIPEIRIETTPDVLQSESEMQTETLRHVDEVQAQTEPLGETQNSTTLDESDESIHCIFGPLPKSKLVEAFLLLLQEPTAPEIKVLRNELTRLGPGHERASKILELLEEFVKEDLSNEQNLQKVEESNKGQKVKATSSYQSNENDIVQCSLSSTIHSEPSDTDVRKTVCLPLKKPSTIKKKQIEEILSSHLEMCSKEKQQLENYKKQLYEENNELSNKNEHLLAVNQQYLSENTELKAEKASLLETEKRLKKDCQNLTRKIDQLIKENKFCESRIKQLNDDKERLLKNNKELEKEKKRANNRIEQLQKENNQHLQQKDELQLKMDKCLKENQKLLNETKQHLKEKEQISNDREQIRKENRQHLRQKDELQLKMDKCSKENQKLLNETKKHLKEKEQISNDREQIRKEKDEFAMKEQLLQETNLRVGELLLENELQRNGIELQLRKICKLDGKCKGFFHQVRKQRERLQELEPLAVDGCNNLVVELL